jgi:uncharacterized protein YifE (UPF0438 family)
MSKPQLTSREEELLKKYHEFYRALDTGTRKPRTEAQTHFMAVCRGHEKAQTEHERAYAKYKRIRATERREQYEYRRAKEGIPEYEDGYPRPDWFTDDD